MASQENHTPLPDIRRIVTGHDANGRAVIQSDSGMPLKGYLPGVASATLWNTNDFPTTDNNSEIDGATRSIQGIVAPNGTSLRVADLAPGASSRTHRTVSLDYNILLQGELILTMDDGVEVHLTKAGDTVVQRGTMHTWRNPGTTWTRWVAFVMDATPVVVDGETLKEEYKN